jgi:uncharacterized membrane protein
MPSEKLFAKNQILRLVIFSVSLILLVLPPVAPLLSAIPGWGEKLARLIFFLFEPTCHQLPERSFFAGIFPWAVCIRCSGFYLGMFILSLYLLIFGQLRRIPVWLYATGFLLPFLDYLMEWFGVYSNLESLRFFTGLSLGLSLMHLVLHNIFDPV